MLIFFKGQGREEGDFYRGCSGYCDSRGDRSTAALHKNGGDILRGGVEGRFSASWLKKKRSTSGDLKCNTSRCPEGCESFGVCNQVAHPTSIFSYYSMFAVGLQGNCFRMSYVGCRMASCVAARRDWVCIAYRAGDWVCLGLFFSGGEGRDIGVTPWYNRG